MGRHTILNKLTDAESLKSVCQFNKDLKNDFLDYLETINRSPGTINGYSNDLDILFVWVLKYLDNKKFTDISKREFIRFQKWLIDENKNSPARVKRIKACISSLSNYITDILDEEEEFENYKSTIRKIEDPPLQAVREKVVWKDEELENLLDRLVEKKLYEQACCVALAMYGGRRKAELTRFKVSDFDNDHLICDNALYKSSPIKTKGNKHLECYTLAKKFKPYFDLWMDERERLGIKSEWLFPSKTDENEHIGITTINSWANTCSRLTGDNFYFHSLRHYQVSALVRAGIPDSVIVDLIGWTSSDMLKIYDDNPKDEKLAKYFKDGDISVPEAKGFGDI